MESLFLLIPLSVLAIAVAVWIFFRMSDSGQFDDMDSPAHGVLLDDDRPAPRTEATDPEEGRRCTAQKLPELDPDQ